MVFPAGADFQTLNVATLDDEVDEPDSVITATITAGEDAQDAAYTIGSPSSASATVVDGDDRLDPGTPGPSTGLSASADGATRIDLIWTAPEDEGGSEITGYRIEWSADGASGWTELVEDTDSDATTYTDSGLRAGTSRYYRVFAMNFAGTGLPSNVAGATTQVDVPPSTKPEVTIGAETTSVAEGAEVTFNLSRTGAALTALTVSVEVSETGSMITGTAPVSADFAAGATEASLTVTTDDDSVDEPDSVIAATLTAGQDAGYVVGSGASATATVLDDDEPPAAVPGAPTDLEAQADGETQIDLSWTAPAETGGAAIAGYRIEWSADGDSDWTELMADTRSDGTAHTDSGLTPGTTRYYRVLAMNSVGTSPPSNVVGATTRQPPAEVTIVAGDSPVMEGADVTFTLRRTGAATEPLTVSVEVTETGSTIRGTAPTTAGFATGAAETTFTVSTTDDSVDESDSRITVTVAADVDVPYAIGSGSSATVTVQDNDAVPGAPRNLAATAEGEAAIDLRWAPPSDPGSSTITGYRIELSADGSSGWTELVTLGDADATEYTDNGLVAGTTRHYRVCAMNSIGTSPPSNVAGATTRQPPAEVTIVAGDSPVMEGADVTFTLRRTGAATEPLTVSVEVTETGSMIGGVPPVAAVFPAGAVETKLTVATIDDSLDEPDQEITATLLDGSGFIVAEPGSAAVRVRDNDAAPVLAIAGASALEGAGELTFVAVLVGRTTMPVQVEWSTSAGTASPDADYAAAGGALTFDPGTASARITVPLRDDALYEEDETFTVSLSRPRNARLSGTAASATGVIENDDAAPVFRIADASAAESIGEMTFTVTLSGESAMPATVRWTSSAATAQPGLDYIEASGELTFAPGTTSRRLAVPLLEDLLVEEAETFRVSLSEATNAAFEAGSVVAATGTIEDDDDTAPAEEWLARFGRTAASNAVDAVEDRLTGRLGTGAQVVVAGHRVDVSARGQDRGDAVSAAAPVAGLGGIGQAAGGAAGLAGSRGGLLDAQPGRYGSGRMDAGDLLARSSFQFSSDSHAGVHRWSVWGRGAATRFAGGQDTLSLDGEVVTGTVGADVERGRVLFGVAVSHSRGDGDYSRPAGGGLRAREGDLSSDLTTGLPYLRVAVSDRLSVWGALGRGSGSMTLSEGDLGSIEADIGMSLGAFGARQELRSSAATDGFSLALSTDLLLVHTTSDETEALPALSTDVNRLRLMVEGARQWQFDSGVVLTPKVELGLRYDDGDAETGGGLELGAGLRVENAARGLSAELTGRSLLAHEVSEFSEWGVGGSLRFEPGGADRGLSIGLRSTLGAASSGIIRLWEQQNAAPLAYRATAPGSTTETEVGYGLAVLGSRGSLTPYLGAGLSERSGEAYKAGARLRVGEFFALDAEAARVERNGAVPSLYRVALLANLRW